MVAPAFFLRRVPIVLAAALALSQDVSAQGTQLQAVEAFFSPAAAVFAADGRTLYIANSARGDFGMIAGRGAISRCSVSGTGALTVTEQQFALNLNAPVGIAVLARATAFAPAGSLVVAVGGSWTTDSRGRSLESDEERGTGVLVLDAQTGRELGKLFLGAGSPVQAMIGHPIMDPFAVSADIGGNLYLTDLAARGSHWGEEGKSQPGILRIDAPAVDALAAGTAPPAGSVRFIPIRSLPTGIAYSSQEDALYWVTGNDAYDLGGAVLRLPRGDFSGASAIQTVAKDLGSLSSIGFSPKGTALVGRMSGDIIQVRGRRGKPITFRDRHHFLSPGQVATTRLDDGKVLVVVPEVSGAGLGQWQHRVYSFVLPADI